MIMIRNILKKRDGKVPAAAAYMTIEASLIIPVAVVLIAAVVSLTFYLYMLCYLNQAAYTAAFRGSRQELSHNTDEVGRELELLLKGSLISTDDIEKNIEVSALSVHVKMDAKVPIPVPGLQLLRDKVWVIHVDKRAVKRDPVFYIWNYQRIE